MENSENLTEKPQKQPKKKRTKLEKWFRKMKRIYYVFMFPFFRYKRYGHSEIFKDRAYIFVGNHLSVLDVIPAALATNKPVHYMAKRELTEKKMGRWFTKKCECIIVNRDGSDVRAVMQAMKYLKNGETVCIFPEGTRNKTDEMFLPFKSGATALSIKTKTPIIPMIQCKKTKAFKTSRVYYGEPFEFTEYYDKKLTEKDIEEADEKLRAIMADLYMRIKDIQYGKKGKK